MPIAILPDGSRKELPEGSSIHDLAASIGAGLAAGAIGARLDDKLVDVTTVIPAGEHTVSIVTAPRTDKKGNSKWRDEQHEKDALYLLRHSAAHVMAEAVQAIRPDAVLAYGPPIDTGFYYDIAIEPPLSSDDFGKIEAEMASIVSADRKFSRYDLEIEHGFTKLKAEGNKYKIDNAERATAGGAQSLSFYVTGELPAALRNGQPEMPEAPDANSDGWEDLCQGPHVPSTGRIGAFKLLSTASSHWHGDTTSDRFQRIYGTAFFGEGDLAAHLERIQEARKRDHRVIGPKLGLFAIDEKVGQGLILWKPKGAVVRQQLQNFIGKHLERQGYSQVFTPHIGRLDLYRTSGHFPYYADSQFPPMVDAEDMQMLANEGCTCAQLANRISEGTVNGYLLKPMNCPHHIRIYASEPHSYRDLPVRLAEFGTVYRWEQSGELGGMTRVRGFTQDDAHLFCTEEQVPAELLKCLELVKIVLATLGMNDYRVRVGLRDPDSSKYVGDPAQWDAAEQACLDAAKTLGVPFSQEPGEAAFYGPKIDFVVKDVIGREWQLGTVQVDYQLPQRFDLEYIGADNTPHRPVMIHRAPFGSMERFIGVLIEHFNGAFPFWLAPVQAKILPISDRFNDYANQLAWRLKSPGRGASGFRVEVDESPQKIGAKIRSASMEKVPYLLIVGEKEVAEGSVTIRKQDGTDEGMVSVDALLERFSDESNIN